LTAFRGLAILCQADILEQEAVSVKPIRITREMTDRYVKEGYWGHPNLADLWERNAREHPDWEALADSRVRLTWAQANRYIDRLALGFLELGFKKDDVLVIQLPNIVESVLVRLAALKAGLLGLPMLMFFRHREVEYVLSYTDAVGMVTPGKLRNFDYFQMVEEIRPRVPSLRYSFVAGDEVPSGAISIREMMERALEEKYPPDYLQQFHFEVGEVTGLSMTSGTTGMPKIVQSMEDTRWVVSEACVERFHYTSDEVLAAFAPMAGGPSGGAV
jgi:non-ribosomal peptide synthetase component E (peptide arylation enzyme)